MNKQTGAYLLPAALSAPATASLWASVALLDEPETPLDLTLELLALRPSLPMTDP